MTTSSRLSTATLTLAFLFTTPALSRAQEAAKTSDDALDSLLEKLADPPAAKSDKSEKSKAKPKTEKPPGNVSGVVKPGAADKSKTAPKSKADAAKPKAKPTEPEKLPTKDQELDDLLEKLGETKDAPTPEDHPKGGGPGQEGKDPSKSTAPDQPDRSKLGRGDKELDERLEELTGRKRKKHGDDGERPAAVNDIVKEMRDVEQRLGKPDTGDDTRTRQKQIVKRIDTLIEQVKKSQSSMRGMAMKRTRQQGQKPGGQQPGEEQQGAMAQGVGAQKPAKPTTQHSTANGKDIWGHLPPELRSEIENMFKEDALSSKAEIVERYYLSVGKGKLVREE
jgi:hypothetical protein